MDQKYLHRALQPLRHKMHLQNGIKLLPVILVISGAVSFLLSFVSLFTVIPFVRLKILYILAAGVPVAIIGTLLMMPSWRRVMIEADNLGLKERVITAWYLKDDPSPVALLQREDTKNALQSVNLASSYRLKISGKLLAAACALIIAAYTFSFIPGRVYSQTRHREALLTETREQEKEIEKKIREQQKEHSEMTDQQLKELLEALEKLKEALKQVKTEEDVLKALAQMENQMAKLQSLDPLQDLKDLENALAGLPLTDESAEALKKEDEEELQKALEQLKKELEDPDAQKELAEQLEKAAANLGDNTMLADALQNLAASASSGAGGELSEKLSELIQQARENANGQQALQQAAAEIGKASSNARRVIAQMDQSISGQQSGSGSKKAQGQQGQGWGKEQGQGQGEGEGEGNQPGSGKSSGQSQGQGGGPGAGEGSTGEDAGYNEGDQRGSGRMPGSRKENEYQRIYVPERLGGEGNETALSGQKLESGSSTFSEADGAPVQKGAMIPWQEVLTEYREQAAQAMESQGIPPGLKDLVRDYFSSLQ